VGAEGSIMGSRGASRRMAA